MVWIASGIPRLKDFCPHGLFQPVGFHPAPDAPGLATRCPRSVEQRGAGSVDQRYAKLKFQILQSDAQGRLADMTTFSRGERKLVGGDQITQRGKFHKDPIFRAIEFDKNTQYSL